MKFHSARASDRHRRHDHVGQHGLSSASITGLFDVVVINRGTSDGLLPGHVLAIWEPGEAVQDKATMRSAARRGCPTSASACCMVFGDL